MRDWSALVRPHLASLRVDERRRLEIGAELAAHLEDTYDSALRRGCTEAEAMTRHARAVLLPGTTMLLAAAAGMSVALSATPADRWAAPRWHVHALAAGLALLYYLMLGAIGAAWSRHVGGSHGERLAAGAFPLVLHVAVVGFGVGEDLLFTLSSGGQGRHLGLHLADFTDMILVMLAAPGAALLLGVLPFTRRAARVDAQ